MLVVTGPESTGKSALSVALGEALGAPVVPEFARTYLMAREGRYTRTDLEAIARGQRQWIEQYRQEADGWLVVDTDWTVLQVWEQFKYRPDAYHWPKGYGALALPHVYLLCAPDFPWAPDPLREHPEAREELFLRYQQVLAQTPAPVLTLYGSLEVRVQKVLSVVGSR